MDKSLPREGVLDRMKFRQGTNISNISSMERTSASFENLFHEYWTPICRLLMRLVIDPAEAEDLAIETFFRLHQRYPLPEEFNTRGWLWRVATNLALQSIRSFKRREHYEITAGKGALETASQNDPPEILDEKEDRRFARLALARLNPRQAQLLTMRYSGMAYKEIAAALNLSQTSIGPLLLRAERDFERQYHMLVEEKR